MRTHDEITAEIKWLRENKPRIKKKTLFGDNNHAAIDAQIEVLVEDLNEDEIRRRKDEEEWTEHEYDNALEARRWMDGESDEAPSNKDSWGGLVK